VRRGAALRYDGRHKVGEDLAAALIAAAAGSVGRHHGEAYRIQVRYTCEDLDVLRRRLRDLERDIDRLLEQHEIGRLLTTIEGIGPQTAARLVATFGDFSSFPSARALASYVGAVPALKQSGKRTFQRASLTPIGAARLRAKLWMPVLTAVRTNPWLRAYYERLIARGKLPKVALVAAMRKLLHAVYSVATHRRPFVANRITAEARP
jgi:transposase